MATVVRHRSGVCKKFVRTQAAHTARAFEKNSASESHVIGNDTRAGDLLAEKLRRVFSPSPPQREERAGVRRQMVSPAYNPSPQPSPRFSGERESGAGDKLPGEESQSFGSLTCFKSGGMNLCSSAFFITRTQPDLCWTVFQISSRQPSRFLRHW